MRAIYFDEGLTLETSALETLYSGQLTLSTQLIKPNYLVLPHQFQHNSFFRNLPSLFQYNFSSDQRDSRSPIGQGLHYISL